MMDLSAMNLTSNDEYLPTDEAPKVTVAREKVLEEAKKALEDQRASDVKLVSLVVIGAYFLGDQLCAYLLKTCTGHVDAGKSTLMGRLLYETGRLDEKTRVANERGSSKAGKSSFSWAWGLDGTAEERERYNL